MKDVMLDIETLGKEPGCIILSIGAVFFDPFKVDLRLDKTFYKNVSKLSGEIIGLIEDENTLQWWKEQKAEAWEQLQVNPADIWVAMAEFISFFKANGGERVWCQGATFDAPIMQEAMKRLSYETPWKFYNVMDTRTVYHVCGFNPYSVKREGTYHNALDDCFHQVKCVTLAMQKGGLGRAA